MNWRRRFVVKLTILAGIVSVAPRLNAGNKTSVEHRVVIKDFNFTPATLSVRVGDTITWLNQDIVPHTATARDNSWDTGELKGGDSFTIEVGDSFSEEYYCLYHPMMAGSVVSRR